MRFFIISWLLLGSFVFSKAQNITQNPYMTRDTCFGFAPNWEPSYYAYGLRIDSCSCKDPSPNGCPLDSIALFPRLLGGNYSLSVVGTQTFAGHIRTFVGNFIKHSLIPNEEYTIEFYYRPWKKTNYFFNRLGAYLGSDTVHAGNYTNYTPVVELTTPMTDTTQWTRFTQSFIAQGGEVILWIGNFRPESQTTLIPNPPYTNAGITVNWGRVPAVFIDGVFLYKSTDTLFTATLPADTMLCPGEVLQLQPVLEDFKLEDTTTTYLWSTGSTDSSIVVTQPGTYWVQTTINQRFVASDTIVVTYFPENYQLNLPDTVLFCEGEMATVLAANIPLTIYNWSTGATTAYITTPIQGLYWLNAQTPCYPLSDSTWVLQDFCETHIWIPNAFTPDGDGTNDFFQFFGVPEPVTISIYNRWGERVFYSNNYNPEVSGWDGTHRGQPLPGGVYTYLIEYKYINPNANQTDPRGSDRQIRGTVQIVR